MGAVRLHDGKALEVKWDDSEFEERLKTRKSYTPASRKRGGMFGPAVDDENDMIFISGAGVHSIGMNGMPTPMAYKLTLQGDSVTARMAWLPEGVEQDGRSKGDAVLFYRGKLYSASGVVFDGLTGKILIGGRNLKRRSRNYVTGAPHMQHFFMVAGDRICGHSGEGQVGVTQVLLLEGRKASENKLYLDVGNVSEEKREQRIGTVGRPKWENFCYASPYTIAGDRVYISSNDHLYCIGK